MKRTMRPGVRLGLGLGRRRFRRLLTLRRRNAGIIRRLGRQAQLRLELGDPAVRDATCAINAAINASFCACERLERSGPADMNPTIQIRRTNASPLTSHESIRRTHHAEMR